MVQSALGRRWGLGTPLAATGSRDLLPLVLAVVAAAVSLPRGFDAPLTRDLGLYAYAGIAVADGVPPYVGVFNRAGPLAHVFPAVGVVAARVVGADEVLGIRVFFLLLGVVSVPVAYWLARDVFGSRSAGVAAAIALATFPSFTAFATGGPREKTPMLLFMLLALWALAHRRWFLAGILIGLATLVLQIALLPLLPPALLGACWLADRGRRLRALGAIGAGGATTLVVVVGWYGLAGRLSDFLDGFLLANARYTEGRGILVRAGHVATRLWDGYGVFLAVFLGGLLVLLAVALALLASPGRRAEPGSRFLVAGAAGAVVGILWCGRDFDSWPDSYPLVPFALLGIGAAAWVVEVGGGRRVAVASTAVWTVAAVVLTTGYSLARRDDGLQEQRASVAAALSVLPEARIASIEAPTALVLAGQRNPTRHQMFGTGLTSYIDDTWPGGLRGFIRELRSGPQQLVAAYPRRTRWDRVLAPRFERVGAAPGIHWYVDTALAPEVRSELRAALAAVDRNAAGDAAG